MSDMNHCSVCDAFLDDLEKAKPPTDRCFNCKPTRR